MDVLNPDENLEEKTFTVTAESSRTSFDLAQRNFIRKLIIKANNL